MDRAIVVHGTLTDPSHIELEQPVADVQGRVELTVRPIRDVVGSPANVLRVMRGLPKLESSDVDELERMIEAGKLPTRAGGLFDTENA